jgi:hypothetical protein
MILGLQKHGIMAHSPPINHKNTRKFVDGRAHISHSGMSIGMLRASRIASPNVRLEEIQA